MKPKVDEGYFPRGESVLRRVHGARIVGFTYGQRALLGQATDPLAFTGLVANTTGLDAPFTRLARTAEMMERVYFGDRATADRTTRTVREMHSKVRGRLTDAAGPLPAGSPYAAEAPDALLWILAWLADSARAAYEAFVRPLDPDERELYWQDYRTVGELFGLARDDSPPDYASFRSYLDGRLASDDLFVTQQAFEVGRRVAFDTPVPASRRLNREALNLAVAGIVPPRVRELYRIPWDPARALAFAALGRSFRAGAWLAPARFRRGPCAREYAAVARIEAGRLAGDDPHG